MGVNVQKTNRKSEKLKLPPFVKVTDNQLSVHNGLLYNFCCNYKPKIQLQYIKLQIKNKKNVTSYESLFLFLAATNLNKTRQIKTQTDKIAKGCF